MRPPAIRSACLAALAFALLAGLSGAPARAQTADACRAASLAAEAESRLPPRLLLAVTRAETARRDRSGRSLSAWPWTVHAAGKSLYFDTKAEAIAETARLMANGVTSIDVGCMQINLHYHGDAFESLEAAFDPATNVGYGAHYLAVLKERHGSWDLAVERYHSPLPERRARYRARIEALLLEERARTGSCAGPAPGETAAPTGILSAALPRPSRCQREARLRLGLAPRSSAAPIIAAALTHPPLRLMTFAQLEDRDAAAR